ncbi:DUF1593 domain-containing protein [Fuerstiella marisgermanici]|uniref:DUF1593 domain-containing protein n=1 Tax=Fuerstiella marisgermanici TaxID=1891926 RepID=A0A1P8WG15_9PLAN|nr:DUF1593 domain-containing protein [Fuerstiella marisgermanici]APZ92993.1 hypothetical protein Fuma_02605 [Fuerstiella marisgermanici]
MNGPIFRLLACALAIALSALPSAALAQHKHRVVILTDISNEPADQESLVRFLTYANEFDVEGIVATTGCWKKSDPDIAAIHRVIDAYEEVVPNLRRHSKDFPDAASLRAVTFSGVDGYGMEAAAKQLDNAAVNHIISLIDRDDERPVWFCAWGGGNTLAAAVMKVRMDRTQAEAEAFVAKVRGYEIALQDEGFAYIAHRYPNVKLISSELQWRGISRTTPTFNKWPETRGGNDEVFNADWVRHNVQTDHGPLGQQYLTAEYLHEGDTPSFLYLIPNGLHFPEHVDFGGWGGRFAAVRQSNIRTGTGNKTVDPLLDQHRDYAMFSDAKDSWTYEGTAYNNEFCAIFRWREAFQNDFAVRMDWCVKPYDQANHNPVAVVNGDKTRGLIELKAKAGDQLTLNAAASTDPDGDQLGYSWWIYNEPGSCSHTITIQNAKTAQPIVQVPDDATGKNFHVILTLTDDATPPLTSYRRIVVSVD